MRPSSRPIPVARRPRVAEERLLDGATAVFAEGGFEGATMDAIAARAGTTKPTLYARFGSKEELFAAAVEREYELRKTRLFEAYGTGDDAPFRERLRTWITAYFDLAAERPEGFALISEGERYAASAPAIERGASAIIDRIAELVTRTSGRTGRRGGRLVASMISGMLRSCATEALRDDSIDLADAAALCESLLYSALRGVDPDLIDAVG
ncbi:MAG: TetR/AcrR family transcriptional regulator [Actinobacteria bacterium]|nr:MAG: TetR/AcrR family transcriptional regulator [Actinomycetota bacterium]